MGNNNMSPDDLQMSNNQHPEGGIHPDAIHPDAPPFHWTLPEEGQVFQTPHGQIGNLSLLIND
jgi:hypothetical protein